jgi:CheY-like chemotaxis protein
MKTILVIEDAPEMREDVVQLLEFEGYQAVGATDGRTGLEMAIACQPDLIVCDVMLPGLDGFATMCAIRQNPALGATPFIFMTARTDVATRQNALALGAQAYLTKPFEAAELLSAILLHLGTTE